MSSVCVQCGRKISPADGMFYYLGSPYYAAIHKECAPFWGYNGMWPHSQPAVYYMNRARVGRPGSAVDDPA